MLVQLFAERWCYTPQLDNRSVVGRCSLFSLLWTVYTTRRMRILDNIIAIHCLQGSQQFLPRFPPLNEKFQCDSLFEVIRAHHCVDFRSAALHTNIHYMTANTRITTKLGTVVPDSPRYNICWFPVYQCGLTSWQKLFQIPNCQASYY